MSEITYTKVQIEEALKQLWTDYHGNEGFSKIHTEDFWEYLNNPPKPDPSTEITVSM